MDRPAQCAEARALNSPSSFLVSAYVTAPKQREAIPFPSKETTVSQGYAATDQSAGQIDVVARCQAGDMEAFETLYRQHSARIYTLACRMGGSPEAGEDLLQKT